MTDYKQLCAELVEDLALWLEYEGPPSRLPETEDESYQLLQRARAALAEPEPKGPTDEEIEEWADACPEAPLEELNPEVYGWRRCFTAHEFSETIRAAIARWGNHLGSPDSSTPQPVPVSERLPGDELCWWYEPDEDDGYGGMWTLLRIRGGTARYSHWLPAHALPQPS